ncbi:MAG: hypothetical protein ACXV5J_06645 [Candidatus Angelobacter sp.]
MTRAIFILALLAAMSTTAFGQGSACPVQITDIRNVGNTVSVLFRNTSRAEMTKYEFVVWFVDFAGETHFLPVLVARKHLRAGRQSGKLVLPAAELQLSFSLAHAYPRTSASLMVAYGTMTGPTVAVQRPCRSKTWGSGTRQRIRCSQDFQGIMSKVTTNWL